MDGALLNVIILFAYGFFISDLAGKLQKEKFYQIPLAQIAFFALMGGLLFFRFKWLGTLTLMGFYAIFSIRKVLKR